MLTKIDKESPNILYTNNDNNEHNSNIVSNTSIIYPVPPSSKKPKFTIQDSYLERYFISYDRSKERNERSNNIKTTNHVIHDSNNIKKEMVNYLKKQEEDDEVVSVFTSNEINKNFSGRKSKRKKQEVDPLDVTSVMGMNGQFRSEYRKYKLEGADEVQLINFNYDKEELDLKNNDIDDKAKSINNLNSNLESIKTEKYTSRIEDQKVDLIPLALRNKQKRK